MTDPGPGETGGTDGDVDCADLADLSRLQALEQLGLTADADARMDEFADWVRLDVGVPVALVSLVRPDSQVFPGMAGLPEPWAALRSTPLSHSFCQHVVLTAAPLVIADARDHPLVRDNLAVADLGVIAYAGMPLTDGAGNVLGALCAIDTTPRNWTGTEIDTLRRIAQACSTDLRLRLARHDAGLEKIRRDALDLAQQRSVERSHAMLLASQAFTETTTSADVLNRIRAVVKSELQPTVVITVMVQGQRLHRLDDLDQAGVPSWFGIHDATPAATAIREARLLHYPDRAAFDARYPTETGALFRRLGLHACAAVPLPGPGGPIGAIVLGWDRPTAAKAIDLLTLASIAGYAGHAFGRALVLEHRITVVQEMQNAMLTTLPTVDGLDMAARYEPADSRENVGGDWYDAATLVEGPGPGPRLLAVSVGDVIGHAMDAATIMGQIRSMLRQAAWDHPGTPPSVTLRAFETANLGLGLNAAGTAVIAHLHQDDAGGWSMSWTNAGHPPPILLPPDGRAELLEDHDALFGYRFAAQAPRADHHRRIAPGSTLFLHTDGLIEHSGHDLDEGTDVLLRLLVDIQDRPVQEIVDTAVDALAPNAPDDVVAFAIRFGRGEHR